MKASRGNILFLILLAVVLFAALAYAVTSSMRGGGNDVSKENTTALAAYLMNQAVHMEQTIMRMIMTGNVKLHQLDFSDAGGRSSNAANTACAIDQCKVYHPDGGGMTPPVTPGRARRPGVTQNLAGSDVQSGVFLSSVKNVGTTLPDVILLMRGVNDAICNEINVKAGVYAEGGAKVNDNMGPGATSGANGTDYDSFDMGLTSPFRTLNADVLGDNDDRIAGKTTFCFLRSVAAGNYVVHVLYAR